MGHNDRSAISSLIGASMLAILLSTVSPYNAYADCIYRDGRSTHYNFVMNDKDKQQLFDGVTLLRYGDAISKAKRLLGEPTDEKDLYQKQTLIDVMLLLPRAFVEHNLDYYIKRVQVDEPNSYDQSISLGFDRRGYLRSINYECMEPLTGTITRRYPDLGLYWTRPPKPEAQHR